MYYAVKDGKVMRHESSSSFRTVYSSSPKAVKVVLSPDEKNVLILGHRQISVDEFLRFSRKCGIDGT